MPRYVASKWKKTMALMDNETIRPYIPLTRKLNSSLLESMLKRYRMVYVKPVSGMHGKGVMKVEKRDGYRYQNGLQSHKFTTFNDLYKSMKKEIKGKPYLMQKGIHLLKHQGRPFDLRVMVQRTPSGSWATTGMIGRVAHVRKVVTNYHNGGTLTPVEVLLAAYANKGRQVALTRQLKELGVEVGKQLEWYFPGIRNLGMDIGLSTNLQPYIIEVNTSPDMTIFRKLANKRVYQRMYRYAKAKR